MKGKSLARVLWKVLVAVLLAVATLGVWSWYSTESSLVLHIPKGEHTIRVENAEGEPVSSAWLIMKSGGKPIPRTLFEMEDVRSIFDDYRGPGSITPNADGVFHLAVRRDIWYFRGEEHKLFWLWPIASVRDPLAGRTIAIEAPGYESTSVSLREVLERENVTLRLQHR